MIKILYENPALIVCVKPAGVLSQTDSRGGESMVSLLSEQTGGNIFPVHRLDAQTGGVMVYAKTAKSAAELSRQIASGEFKKEYLAVLHGVPEKKEDFLSDLLFKDSAKNKSYVVKRERKGVKKAELEYTLEDTAEIGGEKYSLVSVRLFTGRTHQIRVQFSHRGFPLAGDRKYGAKDNFKQLGLWSYKIHFKDPVSGKETEYACPPENIIADYFDIKKPFR